MRRRSESAARERSVLEDRETTFLQNAHGAEVALGDVSVEGTRRDTGQELRQGPGGQASAPVFPSDPVAHRRPAAQFKTDDVAGRFVGHLIRDRVALMFKEEGQVFYGSIPQQNAAR